jgi:glycosyltransferase involved in cell wall biosynthesis
MSRILFVPTLVDGANLNAQIGNARAILADWDVPEWRVSAHACDAPDRRVASNPQIEVARLWRRRAWMAHLILRYLRRCDLIFYPGTSAMDLAGLRWRRRLGKTAPVIATLEGLVGNVAREASYTALARHPVFCQQVPDKVLKRVDDLYRRANHVIAISPFLAKMGQPRYGAKFSVLSLGIDSAHFYARARPQGRRPTVVSAGGVKANKRPGLFLELARRYPQANFIWYGDGDLRAGLIARAVQERMNNVSFPGALSPEGLGEAFRAADIFVLPSRSEGVPKVTQEAAACGLAQVIFGYYEAPSVVHGQNGLVVWSDEAFMRNVGELLDNPALVSSFRKAGAEMALAWDWAKVAGQWRNRLIEVAEGR